MSDANSGTNESVNDGIFSAVAEVNHETYAGRGQLDKASADPASTGATGGGTPTKQKPQKTNDEEESDGDNADGLDTQDFSREVPSTGSEEEAVVEDSDTEPKQTETQPETEVDWTAGIPADPGVFDLPAPKPDEYGLIDPADYGSFIRAQIKHDAAVDKYNDSIISAVTSAVESILPEMKDTPAYRVALESVFSSTGDGNQAVKLAKEFRASIDKVAGEKKAEGAHNAKVSITTQRNASVETKGATQKKSSPTKSDNLSKRLAKNDDSAFAELFDDWQEAGKI